MPISGAMSFTAKSFTKYTDPAGNPFIQMKGSCSDPDIAFKRVVVGVSAGGSFSPPTDPSEGLLSISIPLADFNHLIDCLKKLPAIIMISYVVVDVMIAVTGVSCTSLLAGFTLLEEISKQTDQIADSQKLVLQKLDKALPHKG